MKDRSEDMKDAPFLVVSFKFGQLYQFFAVSQCLREI